MSRKEKLRRAIQALILAIIILIRCTYSKYR